MNERDSRSLRIGDRVNFRPDDVAGTVIDVGYVGFTTRWDDGQVGSIDHRDAQDVSIAEQRRAQRGTR